MLQKSGRDGRAPKGSSCLHYAQENCSTPHADFGPTQEKVLDGLYPLGDK